MPDWWSVVPPTLSRTPIGHSVRNMSENEADLQGCILETSGLEYSGMSMEDTMCLDFRLASWVQAGTTLDI